MSDNPRIEELRRRVQADPASIAFAALAEEYRRVGNYSEAIDTCVAGLKRHPSYLSAHVTLGRALIEVGRFDEAKEELQLVLKAAPENLAAIRGMAEIHHRRGDHTYEETMSNFHEHQAAEAALAQAAADEAAATAKTAELPPASVPPAYEPAPWEVPAVEPVAAEPPAIEPPAFQAPPYPPPAYEAPAYEPPQYDPPGTFDFSQATAAPAVPAPAPVVEQRGPELDALERFLEAVLASRTTLQAH